LTIFQMQRYEKERNKFPISIKIYSLLFAL